MRRLATLLLLFLVAAASPTVVYAHQGLRGVWSSIVRSDGGFGSQWLINPPSTITYRFGALVDFDYEIDGKKIRTILYDDSSDGLTIQRFTIDGNSLTLHGNEAEGDQFMTRVGVPEPEHHAIVGVWSFVHYTGAVALMRYGKGGNGQLSVPLESLTGSYFLSGNQIEIVFSGREIFRGNVELDGDTLTFRGADSDADQHYSRFSD
ncbi:MAG: hypothetical protein OES26_12715 [Gammaproteobacteria bacterium]|nr:hypothetical protein [Gammaproteobacteria bacterium]